MQRAPSTAHSPRNLLQRRCCSCKSRPVASRGRGWGRGGAKATMKRVDDNICLHKYENRQQQQLPPFSAPCPVWPLVAGTRCMLHVAFVAAQCVTWVAFVMPQPPFRKHPWPFSVIAKLPYTFWPRCTLHVAPFHLWLDTLWPGQVPGPSGSQDAWDIFAIAIDMWYEGKEKSLARPQWSLERAENALEIQFAIFANFPIRISVGKVSLLSLIRLCFIAANACGATDQSNFQLYLNPKTFWTPDSNLLRKMFINSPQQFGQKKKQQKLPQAAANLCSSREVSSSSSLFEGRNSPRSAAFRAGCQQFRVGVECLIMGVIMCHWYASGAWQTREREREGEDHAASETFAQETS